MEQLEITCLNCGELHGGEYCPSCGQPASTARFTWKSLFHALLNALDFHHGILYVFRELWMRPRKLVLGYLDGKRANVFPPIKYMLVSIAITAALHFIYKSEDLGMKKVMVDGVEQNLDLFTSTNLSIFHLIILPYYALTTKVLFRKWNLTLPEHLVLNMFALGQMNFLEFIVLSVFFWVPDIVGVSMILSVMVPSYLYFMMCKPRKFGSLVKALAASSIALFMFVMTILVLTILFMFLTNGALGIAPVSP